MKYCSQWMSDILELAEIVIEITTGMTRLKWA